MSNRMRNILFSLTALITGGILYILVRPNTYIGGMLEIDKLRYWCSTYTIDLFKYYLPDFLWGVSLGCALIAIYVPARKGVIIGSSLSLLCGCVWELLQYLEVLSGTGDIHDVIMYILASTVCIIINLKETKK